MLTVLISNSSQELISHKDHKKERNESQIAGLPLFNLLGALCG